MIEFPPLLDKLSDKAQELAKLVQEDEKDVERWYALFEKIQEDIILRLTIRSNPDEGLSGFSPLDEDERAMFEWVQENDQRIRNSCPAHGKSFLRVGFGGRLSCSMCGWAQGG